MDKNEVWMVLSTRVPKRVQHALKVFCTEQDRTMTDVVAEALRDALKRGNRRAAKS